MMQSILSALAVFISTNIDNLFILMIIFSQADSKKSVSHVYLGQYLGTGILVAVSLFTADVLHYIPQDWMIGLLGFIPIYLGIRKAMQGEDETEEEEVIEKLESRGGSHLVRTVALITVAAGGDNLGIYIPFFTSINITAIFMTLIVFAIAIPVLCYTSHHLAKLSFISETLEKYERIIVPIVFIGLGIYILFENSTIQAFFDLI
ncbi:CadD family cadmium resistance transporter [Jeotgalibaca sp. A122]|uniref:CadD family cadmium resistance transporter n=1 Tax=Jeotgalibaca sp. A122 TaxID=3457322 RepID=UPI003FD5C1BF